MGQPSPQPFRLHVPDETLRDLRERLARVRWPDEPPAPPWSTGSSVAYMQDLVAYWRDGFDWRAQEAALNNFRQFKAPLGGIDLHFIHEEGKGPNPMPLLLSHGWPGSIVEFLKVLPMLTDPARFGADPADAFTVVAPSLPGYGLSFAPGQKRFGVEAISEVFASLMTDVLAYPRFAAQGGDWGAAITSQLGYRFPERMIGIHLNFLAAVRRDPKMLENPTAEEKAYLAQLNHFLTEESGYQWIQGTKPTTLAFGLTDSPAGLAAWIVEKFQTWTDCDGNVETAVSRDEMLTDITLYWATGAVGSSFWPYYDRRHSPWPIPEGATIETPTGYVEFPKEILRPPRSVAERVYANIQRWTVMQKGGHFAALEQPEALAQEIRAFFRPLR
jgi:pimeloyl-ACP methyl ester carboxylesterase